MNIFIAKCIIFILSSLNDLNNDLYNILHENHIGIGQSIKIVIYITYIHPYYDTYFHIVHNLHC